ncbi:MAG: hypothetical protein IJ461_04210, partial [Clostridia bacterium]|nr:hypothetical protein [Clostridia bacterium]
MKTSLMDLMEYRFASAPKYSQDGKAIAFLSYRAKADKSGYDSFVNVICPVGGTPLSFTAPMGCTSFGWLNNGALAVTLPKDGKTFVYALTADNGCALWGTLPFSAKIVDGLTNGQLLFSAARPINEEKAQEDGHYSVLDEFPFWYDGKGYISKVRTQLFLMEEGGEPCRISPENLDVAHVAYDAASEKIVYSGVQVEAIRPDWDYVGLYDVAAKTNALPISDRQWRIRQVAMLCGKPVIVASAATESYYAAPKIISVENDGSCTVLAAPGMHIANSVVTDVLYGAGNILMGKGDALYFVVTEGYGAQLYRMDKTGALQRLTSGEGQVSGFDVYGGQVIFCGLRDMRLMEVYRLENGVEKPLTCMNGGVQAPMPEDLSVINSETVPVYGIGRKPQVPAYQKCPG